LSTKKDEEPQLSFEKALGRLEEIVRRLESEELSLDESLELFQLGVGLARHCQKKLDEAERRIEMAIQAADGAIVTRTWQGVSSGE